MSTAVALQNIAPTPDHDASTLRQRSIVKHSSQPSPSASEAEDPWLLSPQDTSASKLPLDSKSFIPTNVYWVTPHGLWSKDIKVLDLTKDLDVPFTGFSATYKDEVKKVLKDHSFTPLFIAKRQHWLGLQWGIEDSQGTAIAHWSHPWTSVRQAILTFPPDSPHSTHPITLENKHWGLACRVIHP